jgi:ribosomal protein S18 acetylase RimI-like enzyme
MIIKPYAPQYLHDLTALMNQWYDTAAYLEEDIARSIEIMKEKSENQTFLAVNEEGKAVGYILTGIDYYVGTKPFAEIIQLLVDKNYRSLGIGASLIDHVEKYYKVSGIEEIHLHSRVERERAHTFYLKNGFIEYKQSKFFLKPL